MKKTIKTLLMLCIVLFGLVSCVTPGDQPGEQPGTQTCQHVPGASWRASDDEHWHVCDKCSDIIDKEAHSFGDWNVMQEPAVGTPGRKVKTCSVCRYYIAEEIPAIEVETGETTGDTVVFAKVPADWSAVNCYYWHNEAGTDNMNPAHKTSWPGVAMTLVDEAENIWAFIVPAGTANVIFNNGSTQTVDIPFATAANLYILSDAAGGDGKFTANVGSYEYTGSLDDIAKYGEREVVELAYVTIYVQLPESWPALYLYFWGSQEACAAWPGADVSNLIDPAKNVHSFELPNDATGVVLSNGLGGDDNQTMDIIPAAGVNAYIVTEGTPKDNAAPASYADGVFTPVEVEVSVPVYYVRGSLNEWGTPDTHKLAYDEATDTATITVAIAAGDQFKIAEASWNNATTISAQNATFDAAQIADLGPNDYNMQAIVSGTYVITITNVSQDTRTCTIVLAE